MNIINTDDIRHMNGKEGLVLQGCGGDPQEWLNGINQMLTDENILRNGTRFTEISVFKHDGSTCLLFPFDDTVDLDMGRLAMWRLQTHSAFGGTWLSDFVDNRLGGFLPPQELQTKFYCPLTVSIYDEEDGYQEVYATLGGHFAAGYEDLISEKVSDYNSRDKNDMSTYYHEKDSLKGKLKSLTWGVESIDDVLYGTITAILTDELTSEETDKLVDFISGQNSDGWGEGFEQVPIKCDDGTMYVSFWNGEDDYFILDEDAFRSKLSASEEPGMGGI